MVILTNISGAMLTLQNEPVTASDWNARVTKEEDRFARDEVWTMFFVIPKAAVRNITDALPQWLGEVAGRYPGIGTFTRARYTCIVAWLYECDLALASKKASKDVRLGLRRLCLAAGRRFGADVYSPERFLRSDQEAFVRLLKAELQVDCSAYVISGGKKSRKRASEADLVPRQK
jgi:hypothetical protein